MAFDFPNSPTTGQVYVPSGGPSYQWNGYAWAKTGVAGPQKETFIDYSGKNSVLALVPTWAKSCRATLSISPSTGASGMGLQMSGDGSTWPSGGTDYYRSGPSHYGAHPTQPFQTSANTGGSYFPISLAGDNSTLNHIITVEIQLQRPSTGDNFAIKSHGISYNFAAGTGAQTTWNLGWLVNTATTSLVIKALIFHGCVGRAGSSIHIQWLGDDAQIPINNAIADAPNDGKSYTRTSQTWADVLNVAPPKPQVAAGVGQWVSVNTAVGAALVLPVGGSWAWLNYSILASTGAVYTAVSSSVSAGGTTIIGGSAGYIHACICWRIA